MREAAERGALRGRGALPQPALRGRAPRRAAGRRPPRDRHDRRDRRRAPRATGRPCRSSRSAAGKLVDRHSFHLENVAGQDLTTIARGVLPRVLRLGAVGAAADRRAARARATSRRSRSSSPSGAARASRCACPSAARSGGSRSSRRRTRELALESEVVASEQKRLRRVEALEELREALNLESLPIRIECFDISNIQGQEIVGSMVVFQDAMPKKAHYRKFGVRGLDGQDDFAAMAEVISRRFARLRRRRPRSTTSRSPPPPNLVVIDGGKGQLSAALAAMQALRPPARGGDRAREAGRGGVRARAGPTRSCSTRTRPACSCCSGSATRRTASRSASTASAAQRGRASRSSTRSRASARRGGGRCCSTSARPSACSRRRRRSSRACRACRRRRRGTIYAQLHKAGRA